MSHANVLNVDVLMSYIWQNKNLFPLQDSLRNWPVFGPRTRFLDFGKIEKIILLFHFFLNLYLVH